MPASSLAKIPRTYAELLRGVQEVLLKGRRDIELAWVRSFHEIGRQINEHVLHFAPRADYGAKVFIDLARDSGMSKRSLHECAQFHRCYPIVRPVAQLGWNRCRLLCQVDDEKQRAILAAQTLKNDWSSRDLIQRVRAFNATIEIESGVTPAKPILQLLKTVCGIVGCFRVAAVADTFGVSGDSGLCVDLGFGQYLPIAPASARYRAKATERGSAEKVSTRCWPEAKAKGADRRAPAGLRAAQIVGVDLEGKISALPDAKPADLFTYAVTVRRVIDGDTIEVAIALPGGVKKLKLRLSGLDCPEIDTPEGKAAKKETERLIAAAKSVIITTSKADKYDRYLASVFLTTADGSEIFLNNHLLENGFAERKDAWEFGDWAKVEKR
mgnify:FL=1